MSSLKRVSRLTCINELEESPIKELEDERRIMLTPSPVSGIVYGLMRSTLSPNEPTSTHRKDRRTSESQGGSNVQKDGRRGLEERTGLFKNAFRIKNTPENTMKSRPKARRLLGMASRRFSSPEPALVSPSNDKENSSSICSPYGGSSPQKIVSKKSRHPLEDCDPNSQDSGYEASYGERIEKLAPRDGFRFAEPLAVAPRRMSTESRGSMESPVRSSPQRTRITRPSLFRSLSSGYESMDDGFNDLIDAESLDDGACLPNGISTLLSGDIVSANVDMDITMTDTLSLEMSHSPGVPSTPEFPRTSCASGNLRRSVSLQSETRQESRKNATSLSRVRSCLFRSPNASSSTAKLSYEDIGSPSMIAATTPRAIPIARRRRGTDIDEFDTERMVVAHEFDSPLSVRAFKRPDPPMDEISPVLVKRSRRSNSFLDIVSTSGKKVESDDGKFVATTVVSLKRSLSESSARMDADDGMEARLRMETHAHIKSAIHRSTTDADLTGDFSKPCVLPLASGHHEDLKSISAETLASLVRGEFNDRIGAFKIVDCRYPYEYDAGHIRGAVNLYSKDLIERILLDPLTSTPKIQPDTNKRNVLVFHCEFSWERGPNLSRFLRNLDRQRNKEHYPALYYPEVYLLHGGYEQFYREHKTLCSPQGYRPMRHPDHEADLRQFRSKSKSWQGEKSRIVGNCTARANLKRLGF